MTKNSVKHKYNKNRFIRKIIKNTEVIRNINPEVKSNNIFDATLENNSSSKNVNVIQNMMVEVMNSITEKASGVEISCRSVTTKSPNTNRGVWKKLLC
jgi:hypothetical protein